MEKVTNQPSSPVLPKVIRYVLGILLAFAALNAFGGGYYAISGAEGVPLEWLAGSPFKNYFIPGLILFFVIGGFFLTSAILVFRQSRFARPVTFLSVAVVYSWLAVQMLIIGYVSWMQPVTAATALVILGLAWFLPRNRREKV